MADDEWDAEAFEPPTAVPVPVKSDRWEGEDEEEPVKESWEDEEETAARKENEARTGDGTGTKKKKKKLEEIIAEKEKKKREELERKRLEEEEELNSLSPEERMAEKLRLQKIQEEADLELAKEAFGIADQSREGSIDYAKPKTKDEFAELGKALSKKVGEFQSSDNYSEFVESLIQDLCLTLELDPLKRVSAAAKALVDEKVKIGKASAKAKKGKGKGASLKMDKAIDVYGEEMADYDDFM
nr:EOG090X0OQM [Lepidurus arcticus]